MRNSIYFIYSRGRPQVEYPTVAGDYPMFHVNIQIAIKMEIIVTTRSKITPKHPELSEFDAGLGSEVVLGDGVETAGLAGVTDGVGLTDVEAEAAGATTGLGATGAAAGFGAVNVGLGAAAAGLLGVNVGLGAAVLFGVNVGLAFV